MNGKMRSCVMGLILGQFSSPLPEVQKEPVAYLYNGVRLPKLPEWDREKYPYAVIGKQVGIYVLLLSQEEPYGSGTAVSTPGAYRLYRTSNSAWVFGSEAEDGTYLSNNGRNLVLWTSNDILHENSTEVYLAESEPIPVYE